MKILVTGAKGQLGYDVCREFTKRKIEYMGVDKEEFDITDEAAVNNYMKNCKPDAVIHCSAYTAVDKAEGEADLCFQINEAGSKNIAKVCKEIDAKLIYISTDYVYDGKGLEPFEVDHPVNPQSVYGKSKLAGEQAVQALVNKLFIVRISWAFGINGSNFVKTMLRIGKDREEVGVVSDQIGSPTYTPDLAKLLCDMVQTDKYGIYHVTNENYCSWAEFAEEIFKEANYKTKVKHLTTEEYPAKAARPQNSRMSKKSLDDAGFSRLPDWQGSLGRFMKELKG